MMSNSPAYLRTKKDEFHMSIYNDFMVTLSACLLYSATHLLENPFDHSSKGSSVDLQKATI